MECNNDAVVNVQVMDRVCDPHLGACVHNVWLDAAIAHIDLHYVNVMKKK